MGMYNETQIRKDIHWCIEQIKCLSKKIVSPVSQTIRQGITDKAPSENTIYEALQEVVQEIQDTRQPYTLWKFVQKGFGNNNLEENELGDIFCGWSNDGTIRVTEGEWLGGSLDDSNHFLFLVQTEIEV